MSVLPNPLPAQNPDEPIPAANATPESVTRRRAHSVPGSEQLEMARQIASSIPRDALKTAERAWELASAEGVVRDSVRELAFLNARRLHDACGDRFEQREWSSIRSDAVAAMDMATSPGLKELCRQAAEAQRAMEEIRDQEQRRMTALMVPPRPVRPPYAHGYPASAGCSCQQGFAQPAPSPIPPSTASHQPDQSREDPKDRSTSPPLSWRVAPSPTGDSFIVSKGDYSVTIKGPSRVRLFRLVAAQPHRDHAWGDIIQALLAQAADAFREGRPVRVPLSEKTLQRQGRRIAKTLGEAGCYWHQDGHGVRWAPPT